MKTVNKAQGNCEQRLVWAGQVEEVGQLLI